MSVKLQMIFDDGQVVQFTAGGSVEAQLSQLVKDALKADIEAQILRGLDDKPIGFWRTKATVLASVEDAVRDVVAQAVDTAVDRAALQFKALSLKAKI